MARVALALILLVVLAVVVEGPPPESRLQNHAAVSDLLKQLFQASRQASEKNQTPLLSLNSPGNGPGAMSGQTGSDNAKSFDCLCYTVDAWRDPWCAYVCQHQILSG
ncbi:uncharacterized protein [Branchiostoma lanceolatum]|uniref:uncharacterized protein n=1 Tax=Branchiostoma lanceolatum TaxID=7740 RepID=UPI00345332B8